MLRVWVVAIVIALFPFIASAEEKAVEEHAEIKAGKEEVIVTVSVEEQLVEVKISILNVNKESKEEQQKGESALSDNKEAVSHKKHSRRRGK